MPTGKIISFLYGEISPALRFKTNLVSFATGLSKLLNKTVRKSGGASNRPGFQYIQQPTFQDGLEVPGRVRLFGFNISRADNEEDEVPVLVVYPSENTENPQVIGVSDAVGALSADRDLTNVKVSQIGSTVVFSNGTEHWVMKRPDTGTGLQDSTLAAKTANVQGGVSQVISRETNPIANRRVRYVVYQVFRTGEEVLYALMPNNGVEPLAAGASFAHNEVQVPLPLDPNVKHYNLYRGSSSASGDISSIGLVGRIPSPSVAGLQNFNDFLPNPDFTQPPPDEDYLYGDFGVGTKELVSARLVGHYQQRRVVVPNSSNSKLKEGSVVLSKAGAVDQLDTQNIFTPIGAFDFTVPIRVKSRILAIIELERLILLTSDVIVIVRGSQQGLLTPAEVNPIVIGYEGCSERVTPAHGARYGFFMSRNDEKLMRISFTADGNVALDDLSLISDHILEGAKVKEMHLTRGKEDTLWLLKYDGKLASITLHEGGQATGWARHETDGFIESITSLNQPRPFTINTNQDNDRYDSLYVLVVRDGVRNIERLSYREDSVVEQYDYVDSSKHFGARLKLNIETNRYDNLDSSDTGGVDEEHISRISDQDFRTSIRFKIGHGVATGTDSLWAEGATLNLEAESVFLMDAIVNGIVVMDFYYDDEGIEKVIRWTQQGDAQAAEFGSANSAPGTFNGDVPSDLRAVLTSRCSRVKKTITGLTHLANKEVSVFADGIVVSSPNNPTYDTLTVDGAGELELDDYYAWGVVGLPYTSELETLDLDTSDNRTLTDSMKLVNRVGVAFHESKGGYVGQTGQTDLAKMEEFLTREDEVLEEVSKNLNEHVTVPFPAEWEKTGRVLIRQVDPLPMTVLAVYPKGIAGD